MRAMKPAVSLMVVLSVVLLSGVSAFAADAGQGDQAYNWDDIGIVLFNLFVFSVVFELAFSVLFNWRWFLARYEKRGIKTPLVVLGAVAFTFGFHIDFMRDLIVAMKYPGAPTGETIKGNIVTALVIAGGSKGVLEMFTKLGIRNPLETNKKAKEAQEQLRAAQAQRDTQAGAPQPSGDATQRMEGAP